MNLPRAPDALGTRLARALQRGLITTPPGGGGYLMHFYALLVSPELYWSDLQNSNSTQ